MHLKIATWYQSGSQKKRHGIKNFTSKNNHCIFKALVFLLLCSGCGAQNSKQQREAVKAIEALGGRVKLDESGNVSNVVLSNTKVSDAGLVHLKGLTSLTTLGLFNTKITDAGLVNLKGLTSLTTLGLGGTGISDAGLVHLKGLTSLRSLFLKGTKVSEAGVKELQAAIPKCKISFEK